MQRTKPPFRADHVGSLLRPADTRCFRPRALPIAMAPALFKPPYDPKADLLPLAAVGAGVNALFAHPSVGANTLAEVVEAARSRRGALTS